MWLDKKKKKQEKTNNYLIMVVLSSLAPIFHKEKLSTVY